jgi:hypothetical protein
VAKLLTIIDLENGLKLKLYDRSRKLAGDRWFVSLTAVIDIPLDGVTVNAANKTAIDPGELKKAIGEKIRFEQRRQRHFIDAAQKDQVLQDLVNSFLTSVRPYLAHPAFAEKVVIKAYRDHLKKKAFSAVNI